MNVHEITRALFAGGLRDALRGLLFEHWGTKAGALALSLLVFVLTRDEISRSFQVPLEVRSDPSRMLLTDLPHAVGVEVRGPWAKINRLSRTQLGSAKLDLRDARPGPLEIDAATIVMPPGVVLGKRELDYDRVDLRFEPIVEREFQISVDFSGDLNEDYELVDSSVHPESWKLRGPEPLLAELRGIRTEPIALDEVRGRWSRRVKLEAPQSGANYVGVMPGQRPWVQIVLETRARRGAAEYVVTLHDALRSVYPQANVAAIRDEERVRVLGPRPELKMLATISNPVDVRARLMSAPKKGRATQVEFSFSPSESLDEATRKALRVDPPRLIVALASESSELSDVPQTPDSEPPTDTENP